MKLMVNEPWINCFTLCVPGYSAEWVHVLRGGGGSSDMAD